MDATAVKTANAGAPVPTKGRRRDSRRGELLDAAAAHFRSAGFAGAVMRDIAAGAGMLAGSIYYYFPSKEDLYLAVYEEGVRRVADAVDEALAALPTPDARDPWQRLERAMAAHLEALLEGGDFAQVVIGDLPADLDRDALVNLRDDYERRFRALIDDLPAITGDDRRMLRLMVMGALNWSRTWYRQPGDAPRDIAAAFIRLLRTAM